MPVFPIDAVSDPDASERDVLRTDLRNSLSVIMVRMQLQQRQLLRADGLLNIQRDQLLDNLATTLAEVRRMSVKLEDLIAEEALRGMPTMVTPGRSAGGWDEPVNHSDHDLTREPG